jgi:hypothetical protein
MQSQRRGCHGWLLIGASYILSIFRQIPLQKITLNKTNSRFQSSVLPLPVIL